MRQHPNIQINDLNQVVRNSAIFDAWRQGNNVHFESQEQTALGKAVANAVIRALDSRQTTERE